MLLCVLIVLLLAPTIPASTYYCASFSDATVNGAFEMEHSGYGVAYYKLSVDLSGYDASTCDLSQGVDYHIHTTWTNVSTNSSIGATFCGSEYTGAHYDPGLACSAKSQYIDTYCSLLQRDISKLYTYSCDTEAYSEGHYALCEVGDLSGKLGVVYETSPGSQQFNQSIAKADYQPPYEPNFDARDAVSSSWKSLVVHCAADGSRLACGRLTRQYSACPTIVFNGTSSSESDDDNTGLDIILVAMGVLVVFVFAFFFGWYFCWVSENPYVPVP